MDDLELDDFYVEALKKPRSNESSKIIESLDEDGDIRDAFAEMLTISRYDDAERDERVKTVRDNVRLQSFHKLTTAVDRYFKNEN